jgi:hypothetical protein
MFEFFLKEKRQATLFRRKQKIGEELPIVSRLGVAALLLSRDFLGFPFPSVVLELSRHCMPRRETLSWTRQFYVRI